jgi:hypothetical protein
MYSLRDGDPVHTDCPIISQFTLIIILVEAHTFNAG